MSKYCYPNNKENLKSPNRNCFLRALPAYHIRPLAQAYTISLSLNLQHSSSKLQYNIIEPKLLPNFKTLHIYRDSYLCCFWTDLHKNNINIHTYLCDQTCGWVNILHKIDILAFSCNFPGYCISRQRAWLLVMN